MATSLDSAQKRLQEAQAKARKRATRETVGPDWPSVNDMELDEALEELTYAALIHGARVSFGVTDGSADVWCRVSFPRSSESPHAGLVAFSTSTTIERVARKVAQLLPPQETRGWQIDKYARE